MELEAGRLLLTNSQHGFYSSLALMPGDIDNQVDTPPNALFGNIQLQVSCATDRKACESADSFFGTAGMNGREHLHGKDFREIPKNSTEGTND
jgi:hypothetical protein